MKTKIVILDSKPLDCGDTDWSVLKEMGQVTSYEFTAPEQIAERCKDASIVLTNKVVFSKKVIDLCPSLRYIGVLATGYNTVDVAYAASKDIVVTNIPSYSTDSVTEHIIAFILSHAKQIINYDKAVHQHEWSNSRTFSFLNEPINEIAGKTLSIIGFGHIGRRLSEVAAVLRMKILVYAPRPKPPLNYKHFSFAALDDLFMNADYLALCCPLTPKTMKIVNNETINMMKQNAVIINTGRGGLINEEEMAEALNRERLGGACLDVLSTEPPQPNNPLLSSKNTIITPHIAWATVEARRRLVAIACANIQAYLKGSPQNQIIAANE